MTDIRQSKEYANYLKSRGWIVERISNINYFIKKLPFIGSVLKIQRPKEIKYKDILDLCKKYRVFQIIIEPKSDVTSRWLLANGYKQTVPFLPSKTLHLDLTKPLKFKKETRRSIRIGDKQKIKEYTTPDEIKLFHNAWKNSVNFMRYVPSYKSLLNIKKSFPQSYSTFLASHNISGGIIGGALFTRSSHYIAYYWYGFTNSEGRTSLSQYSLLSHGILWAKRMKCKVFDFEGIYDDRFPNKSWLGFTHFKKSFGGTEILYHGSFMKYNFFHRFLIPFTKH